MRILDFWWGKSLLWFLLTNILAIFHPLLFHINFRICLPRSKMKPTWSFYWNYILMLLVILNHLPINTVFLSIYLGFYLCSSIVCYSFYIKILHIFLYIYDCLLFFGILTNLKKNIFFAEVQKCHFISNFYFISRRFVVENAYELRLLMCIFLDFLCRKLDFEQW